MTITPAISILSNSPHTVGKEQTTPVGTFQIDWVPVIDQHVLLYRSTSSKCGPSALASHHNGYSLQVIIDRVVKGDARRVKAQFRNIRECGGMTRDDGVVDAIMTCQEEAG